MGLLFAWLLNRPLIAQMTLNSTDEIVTLIGV